MSRTLLTLALVVATTTAASAGTYVGLGVGTAANVDAGVMTQGTGRSGRLVLGLRFGRLSLEGAGSRFGITNTASYDATQLAAALKYSIPLGNDFELFGRGGLERSWLSSGTDRSWSGDGYVLGAGFEYRLNLAVTAASLFVDYERATTAFTDGMAGKFDATTSMWTMGVTLAI